jgi:hypothetical protein
MSVSNLASIYFTTNKKREDLDQRIATLPDVEGKDALMEEMATIIGDLNDTAIQLAAAEAANADEMRDKAMVVIDLRDCAIMNAATTALGISLAKDVAKLAKG